MTLNKRQSSIFDELGSFFHPQKSKSSIVIHESGFWRIKKGKDRMVDVRGGFVCSFPTV